MRFLVNVARDSGTVGVLEALEEEWAYKCVTTKGIYGLYMVFNDIYYDKMSDDD